MLDSFALSEFWKQIIQKRFWLAITLPVPIKAGLTWPLVCLPRKCWGFKPTM